MPAMLRRDALRILEGGVECYLVALSALMAPDHRTRRTPTSRLAPVIGLLGCSAELLIKACLVQAKGPTIMTRSDGFYKFASESMDEFRKAIRAGDPDIGFLWKGAEDPELVRESLSESAAKFRMLQDFRAGGLHAAQAPSRDVVVLVGNDVRDFIEALATCRRLRPYLRNLPTVDQPAISRAALVEDLSRRLMQAAELGDKADLLRALYLVLPHVPEVEPEWLDAFQRVSVTPSEPDVAYLLRTLSEAHGVHLLRQRGTGEGLHVVVKPQDPDAIPIAPYFLKRELTQVPDQFYADVASANGRLQKGILDLPPGDFVLDLFVVGLENTAIYTGEGFRLTAQQAWPFVASAISEQATAKPYWFLIRLCDELPKLQSMLKQAAPYGRAYLRRRLPLVQEGIDCIAKGNAWPDTRPFVHPVVTEVRDCLMWMRRDVAHLSTTAECIPEDYKPMPELTHLLGKVARGQLTVSAVLQQLIPRCADGETERYWARKLVDFAYRYEERAGLLAALRSDELRSVWTRARKAMRVADLLRFGPSVPGVDATAESRL